jgi:putative transposase
MIEAKVPQVQNLFKQILQEPERMFELLAIDLKAQCERVIQELLKTELTQFLKREPYERVQEGGAEKNYRNGSYVRRYGVRHLGELEIRVPRDRKGEFQSKLLRRYERKEGALERDLALLFLNGFSTRSVELVSKSLLGVRVSASEVSKVTGELFQAMERWRNRDLRGLEVKYLIVDGVFFPMRTAEGIRRIPMLVVLGVLRQSNRKIFLALQQGDKDSATTWREVFKDLKNRGLAAEQVELGIMDGLAGLERVFEEEFPRAKVQRCQVHVARNVLTKVPRCRKQEVADRLRDVFYAETRDRAWEAYRRFYETYAQELPSAVQSLERSIHRCLTFYSFPKEEWMSLRTTNAIERVNKEFRRRTKPMEILAGERSAYTILCFIALKMEQTWRSAPLQKLNLPPLRIFTQKT